MSVRAYNYENENGLDPIARRHDMYNRVCDNIGRAAALPGEDPAAIIKELKTGCLWIEPREFGTSASPGTIYIHQVIARGGPATVRVASCSEQLEVLEPEPHTSVVLPEGGKLKIRVRIVNAPLCTKAKIRVELIPANPMVLTTVYILRYRPPSAVLRAIRPLATKPVPVPPRVGSLLGARTPSTPNTTTTVTPSAIGLLSQALTRLGNWRLGKL